MVAAIIALLFIFGISIGFVNLLIGVLYGIAFSKTPVLGYLYLSFKFILV
jgi:hypothetical protein